MTLLRLQKTRAFKAVLGLAIFVAWLGGTLYHYHEATAPSCKVCQALHANQADLPAQGPVARPSLTAESLAAATAPQTVEALLLVPQGRAPPLA